MAISKQLQKAEQYAQTAEAGLDSLQDLTASAASAVLAEYQALYALYEDLKELLLVKAGLEGLHEPLEKTAGDVRGGIRYLAAGRVFAPLACEADQC